MNSILFVNLEGRIGGAERSLLFLVKYLRKDFHIAVACPNPSPLARRLAEIKITSFNLPKPPSRFYSRGLFLIHILKTSFRLTKIVYKVKPVVLHGNSFYATVVLLFPAVLTRGKLVWHARDLTRFGLPSRLCGRFCERVIAVSNAVKDLLIKQGTKAGKIDIVHNGIEARDSNLEAQTKPNDAPIKFANVGQFVPWKKQDIFIKAACRFIQKGGDARFLLVGDDIFGRDCKYKAKLLSQIKNCEIAEKFNLLGWQENMDEVWRQINCLVHTAEREPFGRVIIEAMAHGVPVIAVDNCGPSEIIQNGKTGILVPVNDIGELSEAMLKIASDERFSRGLASAGYEQVVSRFSAEKIAVRIREIYEQILAA